MVKKSKTGIEVGKSVLTLTPHDENLPLPPAGNAGQQESSQTPNNCSVPKSIENNTENIVPENVTDEAYADQRQKCMEAIGSMTGTALRLSYPKEYKTWSNCKNRSKKLKNLQGPHWGPELDSFSGFLKHTGPIRYKDDSLDRIDPSYGYVVGNLRWASKQLQSENRKNVEMIMVRGVPLTKPQLANLLGITYDALRMRLYRGETPEDILAEHFKAEKPAAKSRAARVEECPWPEGKEKAWEQYFQKERRSLLYQYSEAIQNSRTAFFLEKCRQQYAAIQDEGREYSEKHGPDAPLPVDWKKKHEYWQRHLGYAFSQREIVRNELPPTLYRIGPSEEELTMIEVFSGSPPEVTDEDLERDD